MPGRESICNTECTTFEFDFSFANETRVRELRSAVQLHAWTIRQHYIFSWHHYQFWNDDVIMMGNNRVLIDDDFVLYVPHGVTIMCTYPIVALSIGIRKPISNHNVVNSDKHVMVTNNPVHVTQSDTLLSPVESLFMLHVAPAMNLGDVMGCAVAHATPHSAMQMMMDDPDCWVQAEVKMAARFLQFEGDFSDSGSAIYVAGGGGAENRLLKLPELIMMRRNGKPNTMHFGDCIRQYHWPVYLDLIPFWGRKSSPVTKQPTNVIRSSGSFVTIDGMNDD